MDLEPCCAFDLLLRQRVEGLERDLGEVKGRVNALLIGVAMAFVSIVANFLVGRL